MHIENAVMSRRINLYEVPMNTGRLRRLTAGYLISDGGFNGQKQKTTRGAQPSIFSNLLETQSLNR
jgi:hypothetical protein